MRLALVILFCLIAAATPAKVLIFAPRFSQSISNFLGNIADTLVDAGNNVTTLIPIVAPYIKDATHKSTIIHIQPTEEVKKAGDSMRYDDLDFFAHSDFDIISGIGMGYAISTLWTSQCAGVLDEPGLIEKLRADEFDVMIVEGLESCGIALSHLLKPKSLITTSGSVPVAWMYDEFGMELALSYNPNCIISHHNVHSMWDRLKNIYGEIITRLTWLQTRRNVNSLFSTRFGAEFPSVTEIASHAAFTLINSEPLVDYAVPTLSRVHYIGGIGAKEPKKLDKVLDNLLSLRNKTVLVSFGSVVTASTLPIEVRRSIVKAISRFDEVTFLWKYEKPEDDFAKSVSSVVPHLHLLKWLPQNDLLADDRLTAFITHGGAASTQETALRGKPGLFIPFMGDQPRNAGMMEKSGVGKVFDKRYLYDSDVFHAAIKDVIENESYRRTAQHIAQMIRKTPFPAKEKLIKTVAFAAEFGPSPSLRPQSFDMSWVEYHNADIVAFVVLVVVLLVLVLARVVLSCIRNRTSKVKAE